MRTGLIFLLAAGLAFGFTGSFLGSASAQQPFPKGAFTQRQKDASNELSGELLECSAYYLVASGCIEHSTNPGAPEVARDYKKAAERLSTMGFDLGLSIGKSKEALLALGKLSMNKQMAAIKKNCMNAAVLLERYANFCKQLAEQPESRAKELMEGKFCNGSYRCQ